MTFSIGLLFVPWVATCISMTQHLEKHLKSQHLSFPSQILPLIILEFLCTVPLKQKKYSKILLASSFYNLNAFKRQFQPYSSFFFHLLSKDIWMISACTNNCTRRIFKDCGGETVWLYMEWDNVWQAGGQAFMNSLPSPGRENIKWAR